VKVVYKMLISKLSFREQGPRDSFLAEPRYELHNTFLISCFLDINYSYANIRDGVNSTNNVFNCFRHVLKTSYSCLSYLQCLQNLIQALGFISLPSPGFDLPIFSTGQHSLMLDIIRWHSERMNHDAYRIQEAERPHNLSAVRA
jgi:hypothetical protein